MSLLGVKLRRDLRASWPRFGLMVLALAVSLTAFGGMLLAWSSIGGQTSGAYQSTQPASATIVLDDPVDADRLVAIAAAAARRPGVLAATARLQFDTEIKVDGQPRRIPLQVFAATPTDPMRMVRFDLRRPGSWPPARGTIDLRDDALAQLGAAVGDTLTIRTPAGQPVSLRVAGTVYDPSLAPAAQEQKGRGYLNAASLPGTGLNQIKIQIADPGQAVPTRERERAVAVAGAVGSWLGATYGLTVEEIQVPQPYAHPHQWQADVLLLALLAGGAAALLLSTIMVANMLDNLFTQQIPQIGILKAIGARAARIGRLYLLMVLSIAASATVLAVAPATLIGQFLLRSLLAMLGIQPTSLLAPWWAYATMVAVGLALPPLMALIPLVRASRTTVRAAIDHRGMGAASGTAAALVARLGQVRGFDRGVLMALRNTVRRPGRFWLSVGLLASAGAVFVAGMSLTAGTQAIDDQRKQQRYWDVDVQLATPVAQDQANALIAQVPGVRRVQAWNRTQISVAGPGQLPFSRTYPDQGHGSVAVNTVLPGQPQPRLLEGRWLRPGETGAVVLNQIVRDSSVPGLGPGDAVRLYVAGKPTTWRIAGIVEERETHGGGAYATADGLAAATGQPPRVNQFRIVTDRHDEASRTAVAAAIDKALGSARINVALAASISSSEEAASGHLGPVLLVLLAVALPLGLVGGIGLASTMSANVLDRIREFGVMHAIGARPRTVRRIVVAEGVFLALTSCLVAAIPAALLTGVLGAGLGTLFTNAPLPYRISVPAVAIWVALAVLGAALATEAAASRAARLTVREALTYL